MADWRGGRVQGRVQEADHVGFPSPGRGGQALSVPGVRRDHTWTVDGEAALEPAGRDGLIGAGPAGDDRHRAGAAARMASRMLIG